MSLAPVWYGNDAAETIVMTIALPTTSTSYTEGHLKKIHIIWQPPAGSPYELDTLYGPWASSPVSWTGPFPPIIQTTASIAGTLFLTTENDDGIITQTVDDIGNLPYSTSLTIPALAISSVTAAATVPANLWQEPNGVLHVVLTFATTTVSNEPMTVTYWAKKQGTCTVTGGVNIQSTAGHTFANYDTGINILIGSQWSTILSVTDATHAVLATAVTSGAGVSFTVFQWLGWYQIESVGQVVIVGRQGDNNSAIFSPVVNNETWIIAASPGPINGQDPIPATLVSSSGFTVVAAPSAASTVATDAYVDALTYPNSGGVACFAWQNLYTTITRNPGVFAAWFTWQTGAGTGGSFVPGGAHPVEEQFYAVPTPTINGGLPGSTVVVDIPPQFGWVVPIDGNSTGRLKMYVQGQTQASANPPTATQQNCWSSAMGVSTPGTNPYQDIVIDPTQTALIPHATPGVGAALTILAVDLAEPWRDVMGDLFTVLQYTVNISVGTAPMLFTTWLDVADGNGPQLQGCFTATTTSWSMVIGQLGSPVQMPYPLITTQTPWTVYASPGNIQSALPPAGSASCSFAVATAQVCLATDVTGAIFNQNPKTLDVMDYTGTGAAGMYWDPYQLQWVLPTIMADPSCMKTFITRQKGYASTGTGTVTTVGGVSTLQSTAGVTFTTAQVGYLIHTGSDPENRIATYVDSHHVTLQNTATNGTGLAFEVWNPAPDSEGGNDTASNGGTIYHGMMVTDSGCYIGIDGGTTAMTVTYDGDWPPDQTLPPAINADGSANLYRTFRYWSWALSILSLNPTNTINPVTLQAIAWSGADHFDLTPVAQPSTIDLSAANPYTVGPALKVTGSGMDVRAAGITATYMGANAITAANSPTVVGALAFVDAQIASTGINKLAATTSTQGTAIFTGDVILSRGSANPVIDLSSTGIYLFGVAATGGASGLTAQPYVAVQNTGILVSGGGTGPSVTVIGSGINLWTVNGNSAYPYVQVTGLLMQWVNGNHIVAISSAGITLENNLTGMSVTVNATGVTISAAGSSLTATATAITLTGAAGNSVSVSTSSGASVQVTSGTVTVNVDGTNYVKVTDSLLPSYSQMSGTGFKNQATGNSAFASLGISGPYSTLGVLALQDSVGNKLLIQSAVSTTASAGSATLPAAPAGFIDGSWGAATIHIPYYL